VQSIPNDGLLRFRSFFNEERLIPTSPETLKSVLADNSYDFEKPAGVRKFLSMILGAGLIIVEGDVHKFQRKNVLPSFQLKHLKELYRVFWSKGCELGEAIEAEINEKNHEKTQTGEEPVVEFGDWATRVTLDIIGVAGMGRDFRAIKESDDELVQAYNSLLEPTIEKSVYFAMNILGPQDLVQKLPWKQNKELKRVTGNLKRFCLENVQRKKADLKAGGKAGDDLLTLLIQSNSFSDQELVDQMLTFLAAG
jgi:cytochrome P450